jgi:DNA polymerase I-like protein with 3'-5' exonuclease and polymerase domains
MPVITIDFETFYSKDYSLTKMSTHDYVRDPRFETIMCSFKVNDGDTVIAVGHKAVAAKFAEFDWSKCAMCAHNMRFDGDVAKHHFGVVPALYLDTMGMAQGTVKAVTGRVSLDAVSKYLGLPDKGTAVHNAIGKTLADIRACGELPDYMAYCLRDTDNCREIFTTLMTRFPRSELRWIDTLLRMYIEPQVKLDPDVLAKHLGNVRAEAERARAQVAHIPKDVFSSQKKFKALLEEHGVEVPMKKSSTTGEMIPALAKNDRKFRELCDDPDNTPVVQALLGARMNAKGTLAEASTERLIYQALTEQGDAHVPLKYWGAHTGRVSGNEGVNWLNFKRGSMIRQAVVAPNDQRIVHRDASQIEARMLAYLAGCEELLGAFRDPKRDPYCEFASSVYGVPVYKADKVRRFVGKTGILGLGYQTGWEKLRHTLFIGNGGIQVKVEENEAKDIVYGYRRKYREVPELWQRADMMIAAMLIAGSPTNDVVRGLGKAVNYLPPFPIIEQGHDCIWLPNGTCIAYPKIQRRTWLDDNGHKESEICYSDGLQGWKKIYGGKLTENACQGLTRIIVTDVADNVRKITGYRPWMHTYDSLDWCVPASEAEAFNQIVEEEFARIPMWAPGLPLASEGGWGRTLFDAEEGRNT